MQQQHGYGLHRMVQADPALAFRSADIRILRHCSRRCCAAEWETGLAENLQRQPIET